MENESLPSTVAKCTMAVEGKPVEMCLLFGPLLACVHVHRENRTQHVKGPREKQACAFRTVVGMRRRAGGISFLSVSVAVKGDVIREKAISLPYPSVSFSTCTFTQPSSPSLSRFHLAVFGHLIFSF